MLKVVSVALRLRYIIPATAVGGYYSAKKKYDDIKESLPEMPDFVKKLLSSSKESLDSLDLDSWSATLSESTQTFNEWLEEAGNAIRNRAEQASEQARKYFGREIFVTTENVAIHLNVFCGCRLFQIILITS